MEPSRSSRRQELAKQLRHLRTKELKLSQENFASRLSVSRTTVTHWEKGRHLPLEVNLDNIAQRLLSDFPKSAASIEKLRDTYNAILSEEIDLRVQKEPPLSTRVRYLDDLLHELNGGEGYPSMLAVRDKGLSSPDVIDDLLLKVVAEHGDLLPSTEEKPPRAARDIVAEVAQRSPSRIALLGDSGGGKTTTLRRIAVELAVAARDDATAPIPVVVDLQAYKGKLPLWNYIADYATLRQLAPFLDYLLRHNRLALLLDGLNDVPRRSDVSRIQEIKHFIDSHRRMTVVVTCRSVNYTPDVNLGLDTWNLEKLNPLQIRTVILHRMGDQDGSALFWQLPGDPKAREFWEAFERAGGTDGQFWLDSREPEGLSDLSWTKGYWGEWLRIRDNPLNLLALARNPFMLSLIIRVAQFVPEGLPANRYQLFDVFTDFVMRAEEVTRKKTRAFWLPKDEQRRHLTKLAFEMRRQGLFPCDALNAIKLIGSVEMLGLAIDEKLLQSEGEGFVFMHQLMQEYFAADALDDLRLSGTRADEFWPSAAWWEPSGWEETVILITGKHRDDPLPILSWIRDANPELAARCVTESGTDIPPAYTQTLAAAWIPRLNDSEEPVPARAAIGRALGRIDADRRPGVCVLDKRGLPEIEWCVVPAAKFMRGTAPDTWVDEIPYTFQMSRYLVTNAQFEPFINDGGYTSRWQGCWTRTGWEIKGDREGPQDYTEIFRLPNHPRIGIDWYEAHAFSRWLTERLTKIGKIKDGWVVRLPTESEWELAARGSEGSDFPWGNDFSYSKCNVNLIRSTTAVGIYPDGASPHGVHDMVGNAWKWCQTRWHEDPRVQDNDPEGDAPRCYRGGSWAYDFNTSKWRPEELRCGERYWIVPEDDREDAIGIFLVMAPKITSS